MSVNGLKYLKNKVQKDCHTKKLFFSLFRVLTIYLEMGRKRFKRQAIKDK